MSSSSRRTTTAVLRKKQHGRSRGQTGSAATGAGLLSGAPHELVSRRSDPLQNYSSDIQPHSMPRQRHKKHAVSGLTFGSLPYTVLCVCAPSVVAERRHYFMQELLPSVQADRHLVRGDLHCIVGQQDMLDPASPPGQRTLGYFFFKGKACAVTRLVAQHAMQQEQNGIGQETSLSGGTHSTPAGG